MGLAVVSAACAPREHAPATTKHGAMRDYALESLVGAPRRRDVARGLVLLDIACRRGDARACVEEGIALDVYDGRATALGRAWRLFEDACTRPTKTACEGDRAGDDAFTKRDSCGKNTVEMLACYNLSDLYARGVVSAPDSADADVLTKRACAGGFKRACE